MDTFRCNLLMMMDVTVKVDPVHQGYCRSAGSVGFTAYEELVERRALFSVPCCAEVTDIKTKGMSNPMHVPMSHE